MNDGCFRSLIQYPGQLQRAQREKCLALTTMSALATAAPQDFARVHRCTAPKPLSAGGLQATRLSLGRRGKYDRAGERMEHGKIVRAYVGTMNVVEEHEIYLPGSGEEFIGTKGSKASLPVAANSKKVRNLSGHVHRAEVQSITSVIRGEIEIVASVDAYGKVQVSRNGEGVSKSEQGEYMEESWAGIDFGDNGASIITAHYCGRRLALYDVAVGKTTSKVYTAMTPTAVCSFNNVLIGCAEATCLSLWDIRGPATEGHCPLVGRADVSSLHKKLLFCVAHPEQDGAGHLLLAAGADRTVYGVDMRTWKIAHRWRSPLKYEAIGLALSPSMPSTCYVAGLDNDILCGVWGNPRVPHQPKVANEASKSKLFQNHHCGFRGDSRWVGLAAYSEDGLSDTVVGVCDSGSLYIIENAEVMKV